MARYEDLLDEMEEKNKLLSLRLKQAQQEAKDWRKCASGLAHALSLISSPTGRPRWIKDYYHEWEMKHKEWWNV